MQEKRHKILVEALKIVPFDGWTDKTLEESAVAAGFDPKYSKIAFPGGVSEIVDYFLRDLDDKMLKKLSSLKTENYNIRKKIATAVKTRLELAEPDKGVIRKTVSYFALPYHAFDSIQSIWKTVDAIWYFAGDKSADFNYYTKRTILAGVYSSTLLYWLNDKSKNHQDTWDFLDRRIENVMSINKIKSSLLNFTNRFYN